MALWRCHVVVLAVYAAGWLVLENVVFGNNAVYASSTALQALMAASMIVLFTQPILFAVGISLGRRVGPWRLVALMALACALVFPAVHNEFRVPQYICAISTLFCSTWLITVRWLGVTLYVDSAEPSGDPTEVSGQFGLAGMLNTVVALAVTAALASTTWRLVDLERGVTIYELLFLPGVGSVFFAGIGVVVVWLALGTKQRWLPGGVIVMGLAASLAGFLAIDLWYFWIPVENVLGRVVLVAGTTSVATALLCLYRSAGVRATWQWRRRKV